MLEGKLIIRCVDSHLVRHDILGVRWILKSCSSLNTIDAYYLTKFSVRS